MGTGIIDILELANRRGDGAAEKCPDARRVAPIRDSVWREYLVLEETQALMGATRPASVFSAASSRVGHFSAASSPRQHVNQ